MRLGTSGIGWLIFGIIVCASYSEADGLPAKLSTIALGLVFVAVYLIKNWFDPRYKALFILGGMLIAFSIENGKDPDTVTALCIASVFLCIFYFINKDVINAWLEGASITDYPYDEEYEEYAEEEESGEHGEPDGNGIPADGNESGIDQSDSEDVVEFNFGRSEK